MLHMYLPRRTHFLAQFSMDVIFHTLLSTTSNPFFVPCAESTHIISPILLYQSAMPKESTQTFPQFNLTFFTRNLPTLLPDLPTKPHLIPLSRTGFDFVSGCEHGSGAALKDKFNSLLCEQLHPNLWFVVLEEPAPSVWWAIPQGDRAIVAPYPTRLLREQTDLHCVSEFNQAIFDSPQDLTTITTTTTERILDFRTAARPNLVYMSFKLRLKDRIELKNQCDAKPNSCIFYEKDNNQTQYLITNRKHMESSVDSLIHGCIPVILQPYTLALHDILPYHTTVIHLTPPDIFKYKNIMDILSSIPPTRILEMQQNIAKHRHAWQYSKTPFWKNGTETSASGWTVEEVSEGGLKPWDDAVTCIVKEFARKSILSKMDYSG
ncbi:hypothetical protein HDU98_005016, partial [Podochytrium sp. JEL0797]